MVTSFQVSSTLYYSCIKFQFFLSVPLIYVVHHEGVQKGMNWNKLKALKPYEMNFGPCIFTIYNVIRLNYHQHVTLD